MKDVALLLPELVFTLHFFNAPQENVHSIHKVSLSEEDALCRSCRIVGISGVDAGMTEIRPPSLLGTLPDSGAFSLCFQWCCFVKPLHVGCQPGVRLPSAFAHVDLVGDHVKLDSVCR